MKRKLTWTLIALLTLIVGGGAFLYFTRPESDAISPANCAKFKKGMAYEEIKAILGGPPSHSFVIPVPGSDISSVAMWKGKRGVIQVEYDRAGSMAAARYCPNETSFLDKLRMWLGW